LPSFKQKYLKGIDKKEFILKYLESIFILSSASSEVGIPTGYSCSTRRQMAECAPDNTRILNAISENK